MELFHQRLGPQAMVRDLDELSIEDMQQFDPYKDELINVDTFPALDEEPEVTQECRDQH